MGRAVLFHAHGRPLEATRHADLTPRGAEILVRVTCCTLCRSDLHTHAGRRMEKTPLVLGHEIIGRIEAFGPEASRTDARGATVSAGDRVTWAITASCGACFFCRNDLPQKCERLYKYGHERAKPETPTGGGLADSILLIPGTAWLRVPDELSDFTAAPANCATATVAALLRTAGAIANRTVLVLGAGMLGVTACAMARAMGARNVLASDPNPECLRRAPSFGATHTFPAETQALAAGVADSTEDRGADVVLELAGAAPSVQAGLQLVRIGGTLVLAGTVAPVPAIPLDAEAVVRRMLTIRGVHNYYPRDLATALDFLAGPGRQYPFETLVGETFPLENVEQAFASAHAHPGKRVAVIP